MVTLLSKLFIKREMSEEARREAYGTLSGLLGIFLNIILFAGKFLAGTLSASVAITADAFNNLSDAASSVVTLIGFKLANKKPDPDHPYGFGRMEYITGFVVSALILAMGFSLVRDSVEKIIHPEDTNFSLLIGGILVASILVKCYMAFYNFSLGKKIGSAALRATALDSLTDCISTGVALAAAVAGYLWGVRIDGWCGTAVGLVVTWAGFTAIRETLSPLLGQPPEKEMVEEISHIVMEFDSCVLGMHDLLVHDYGPSRRFISLHAEVPAEGDILEIHDVIDNLEKKLNQELGCLSTVHMDPVETENEEVQRLKAAIRDLLAAWDTRLSFHDFRVVFGESHTNLIFDLVIPVENRDKKNEIRREVTRRIKENLGNHYEAVIEIDEDMANVS